MAPHPAIKRLGMLLVEYRAQRGLSQEKLAEQIPESNRSEIAYLEEGTRLPKPDRVRVIFDFLSISRNLWWCATSENYLLASDFQDWLGELIGKPLSLSHIDDVASHLACERVSRIFKERMTEQQAFAEFTGVLSFYGERPCTFAFFNKFLGAESMASLEAFGARVREFQKVGLRLYGNFRRAWKKLSPLDSLEEELKPLNPASVLEYTQRLPFTSICSISTDRLDELGYIAADKIRTDQREREELASRLNELAESIRKFGASAFTSLAPKKKRRLQRLIKKYNSSIELDSPLFQTSDPEVVKKEADRVLPPNTDIVRMEETQSMGRRNLAVYLTEPYLDVYVATSMRDHADFVSANSFVEHLFQSPHLKLLNLRYFNPTQSWISDRVAKGLVEALMLRRAKLTVYMAQKTDTFGKDSEASVALGQGKSVVVYVPKIIDRESGVDSEMLFKMDEVQLADRYTTLGLEDEEGLDKRERVRHILERQLFALSPTDLARVLVRHWADFDLLGEVPKMPESVRVEARNYLEYISSENIVQLPNISQSAAIEIVKRLVDVGLQFESRARTFKEIHPLALQVIIESGVLNGIVVVRSVDLCAEIIYKLLTNTIDTDIVVDEHNYKLCERSTGSVLRVISKYNLLTYAFWTQYFRDSDSEVI